MTNKPHGLIPRNYLETRIEGIREEVSPSDVRVYKANPDGSRGELVRIDQLENYTMLNFNRSHYGRNKK